MLYQKALAESQAYFKHIHRPITHYRSLQGNTQQLNFLQCYILHNHRDHHTIIVFVRQMVQEGTQNEQFYKLVLKAIWSLNLIMQVHDLQKLVNLLNINNIISPLLLVSYLPESLLDGIIDQAAIDRKYSRAYTKNHYEQTKYNLFKQNNQGYTKLSLLLLNIASNDTSDSIWNRIIDYVGNFDLDPDRVLALVIQTALQNCSNALVGSHNGDILNIYETIISKFKKESITVILGNKILNLCSNSKMDQRVYCGPIEMFFNSSMLALWKQNGFIPSPKRMALIARLISKQIISIDDIMVYMGPSDDAFSKVHIQHMQVGRQYLLKCNKLILEQLSEEEKIKLEEKENHMFMGQFIYSTKLMLINELLKLNEWELFRKVWKPYRNKVDLIHYQPILHTLCRLLQWAIDGIYQQISYGKYFRHQNRKKVIFNNGIQMKKKDGIVQSSRIDEEFIRTIKKILQYMGGYIGFRTNLYMKICMILKRIKMQSRQLIIELDKVIIDNEIKSILKNYLLPGICYQNNNPILSNAIFEVLELYEYRFRYECYLYVYNENLVNNAYLIRLFQKIKLRQNIIVNNLSNTNKKLFIKKMGKMSHNHIFQVFYWIVKRLMQAAYQSVIPQIIQSMNHFTNMSLQITIFSMLLSLHEQKLPAINPKTLECSAWYKNTVIFISLFYRKYIEIDIQPLFDHIIIEISKPVRQIQDSDQSPGAMLKLLHELLNRMYGSFMLTEINKSKYDIIASGPRMQFQMLYEDTQIKLTRKSKNTLQNFFWNNNLNYFNNNSLAFNILVLLVQKRSQIIHRSYSQDLKVISSIYDQYTIVIIQLIRFYMNQSVNYEHYGKLLPMDGLNIMLNQYKLPLEICFQIIRPSFKSISIMNENQWNQINNYILNVIDLFINNQNFFIKGFNLYPQLDQYLNTSKKKFKELMPIHFFTTFWMLTLDSIYFPAQLYAKKKQQLKNKIAKNMPSQRGYDRDSEKPKSLLQRIQKQQQKQRKKASDTFTEQNMRKFQVQLLKSTDKQQKQAFINFCQIFTQTCLLPRMLLDANDALYCFKFVIQVIKANKMSSSKSIKFLTYITEYFSNYLPFSTQRQTLNCLVVFTSEILNIFVNWNEPSKLKQDIKEHLQIQQTKDHYLHQREYLLLLFQRVGNLIMSIKNEPYLIKNSLFFLQKIDALPRFKEQANQLQEHMKSLKMQYTTEDMKMVLDRIIVILNNSKSNLPQKGEDPRKKVDLTTKTNLVNTQQLSKTEKKTTLKNKIKTENKIDTQEIDTSKEYKEKQMNTVQKLVRLSKQDIKNKNIKDNQMKKNQETKLSKEGKELKKGNYNHQKQLFVQSNPDKTPENKPHQNKPTNLSQEIGTQFNNSNIRPQNIINSNTQDKEPLRKDTTNLQQNGEDHLNEKKQSMVEEKDKQKDKSTGLKTVKTVKQLRQEQQKKEANQSIVKNQHQSIIPSDRSNPQSQIRNPQKRASEGSQATLERLRANLIKRREAIKASQSRAGQQKQLGRENGSGGRQAGEIQSGEENEPRDRSELQGTKGQEGLTDLKNGQVGREKAQGIRQKDKRQQELQSEQREQGQIHEETTIRGETQLSLGERLQKTGERQSATFQGQRKGKEA